MGNSKNRHDDDNSNGFIVASWRKPQKIFLCKFLFILEFLNYRMFVRQIFCISRVQKIIWFDFPAYLSSYKNLKRGQPCLFLSLCTKDGKSNHLAGSTVFCRWTYLIWPSCFVVLGSRKVAATAFEWYCWGTKAI